MISDLCHELNNWFDENPRTGTKRRYFGKFVIDNGEIDLDHIDIQVGQYFRIVGSVFNDGVYKYEPKGNSPVLNDEVFEGAIWVMSIPASVIALSSEIDDWQAKYGGVDSAAMSPFTSESFGGYSYSKTSSSGSNGTGIGGAGTWQSAFANRLNKWRKI